jgi:ABC-type uncharacterized transport system permease subunit
LISLKLERRPTSIKSVYVAGIPVVGAVIGLLIAAVILAVTRHNPFSTYGIMLQFAFGSLRGVNSTLVQMTPLLLTGLAALVAFRAGVYNIGAEGQLYIGAMSASGVALALRGQTPIVIIPCMLIAGALGGVAWALIPALSRVLYDANEILTTLMMNYIGGLLITYLIFNSDSYWRDLSTSFARSYPVGKTIPINANWPALGIAGFTLPLGLLVGLGVSILVMLWFRQGRGGFFARVFANSPLTAQYTGVRTKRLVFGIFLASGALAGIAGASQIGDFAHLLDPSSLQAAGYGYAGILVAVLAMLNPLGLILSSLFLGGLTNAGFALEGPKFPNGTVGTLEGIILFCVVGMLTLVNYRIRIVNQARFTPLKASKDGSTTAGVQEKSTFSRVRFFSSNPFGKRD